MGKGQGPSLWYLLGSKLIWDLFSQGAHEPLLKSLLIENAGVL